ncbi:MAG TPA: hypothetical protein VF343_08310 [Syntrophales bacterium]
MGDRESALAYLTILGDHSQDPKEIEAIDEELQGVSLGIPCNRVEAHGIHSAVYPHLGKTLDIA